MYAIGFEDNPLWRICDTLAKAEALCLENYVKNVPFFISDGDTENIVSIVYGGKVFTAGIRCLLRREPLDMRVNLEDVRRMIAERKALNALDLTDIEWHENGQRIDLDEEAVADFDYTGLAVIDFVSSGALDCARVERSDHEQQTR